MRLGRAAAAALLGLALGAAPAAAQSPPATTLRFDDLAAGTTETGVYPTTLNVVAATDCPSNPATIVARADAPSQPNVLFADCTPTIRITFRAGLQSYVAMQVRSLDSGSLASSLFADNVDLQAFDATGQPLGSPVTATGTLADWKPLTLSMPGIGSVWASTTDSMIALDDLTFSPSPQPDTIISGGPSGETTSTSAQFQVSSTVAGSTFRCSLDGIPLSECGLQFNSLTLGSHTFTAVAADPYGNVDPTPAIRTWTIVAPPTTSDRDNDGLVDPVDNCPDNANANQADEDDDGVGDACETLPSGDLTPIAGRRAQVQVVSGEVFVRLPRGSSSKQLRPGFVPLKGQATVPVGSTLDTTKGQVAVTSASEFRNRRKGRARTQQGTFAASIFTIKQRRARARRGPRRPTTDLVLRSPPNAEQACAGRRPPSGPKGNVRTISGTTAKGQFRTIGGASITTVRTATFITTDRCDGTLTEVGRGRASVFDKGRRRTVRVRPGQAYLARARLFQARRRNP
jgi:hypothetical protein